MGDVTLNNGGEDLDHNLPTPGLSGAVIVGKWGATLTVGSGVEQGMKLALYGWSRPGKEACIQALNQFTGNSDGKYTYTLAVGQYVCLRTAEQNIAVIKVGTHSASADGIAATMKALVWRYDN